MSSDGFYAVIEAIWPTYELDDLDKVVIIGHPLTIEKTEADKSLDLKEGENLGAIQVKHVRKCVNIRKGHLAPPHNRRLKKKPTPTPRPVTIVRERVVEREVKVVQQVIQKAPEVDTDALVRKMTEAFGGVMDQKLKEQEANLRAEFKALKDAKTTVAEQPDLESLKDSIQGMLKDVVGQRSTTQVQETSQDTPVFIPSKILSGKTTDNIQVKQTTSTAEGVDDAAAKLKALRKRRKENGMG